MLLSIAWKNIWRNKVRSLVIIGAIAFGLAGTLFVIGLSQGFIQDRNKKIIETSLANIQIHNPRFVDNMKIADTISGSGQVIKLLRNQPFVKSFSLRFKTMAMASSSYASGGVIVTGIDPKQEKSVTKLYNYLADSNSLFLDQTHKDNAIIIGRALAKKLQMVWFKITDKTLADLLEIGVPQNVIDKLDSIKGVYFHTTVRFYNTLEDLLSENEYNQYADLIADRCMHYKLRRKIVLRMQDGHGQVVEEAFRIVGVFNTQNDMFDGSYVFVKKDYLLQLLGLPQNRTNEIAILVNDTKKLNKYVTVLQQKLPRLLVQSMYDLDPLLKMSKTMIKLYYLIFIVFILFALSFGIINTMLMAVLERTKELGMLMAIGMNKKRVFGMIMYETILLTFTGGILGMIIGSLIVMATSHTGINFSKYIEAGMQSIGFSSIIYPELPFWILIETTLLVVATGVVAAIYPAWKALRLKPAQALRTDV